MADFSKFSLFNMLYPTCSLWKTLLILWKTLIFKGFSRPKNFKLVENFFKKLVKSFFYFFQILLFAQSDKIRFINRSYTQNLQTKKHKREVKNTPRVCVFFSQAHREFLKMTREICRKNILPRQGRNTTLPLFSEQPPPWRTHGCQISAPQRT